MIDVASAGRVCPRGRIVLRRLDPAFPQGHRVVKPHTARCCAEGTRARDKTRGKQLFLIFVFGCERLPSNMQQHAVARIETTSESTTMKCEEGVRHSDGFPHI
jgi:hypothetical protein